MTLLDTATVTTDPAGSVTTPAGAVPADTAGRFSARVPARPVPAPRSAAVPPATFGGTVPRPTLSGTDTIEGPDTELYARYVTNAGWFAWFAVEVDSGAGWEIVAQGRAVIADGTQRELDDLVDRKVAVAEVGRYAVVRVSASSCDERGRSLIAYRETTLPLLHPRTAKAAARRATA